ncbi:ABC transporter ATP-binding protein [Deltaproteobacteria bacterium]|nr:ABC transporter ATP-binding protein [Deltaproteobacteria bacterium]
MKPVISIENLGKKYRISHADSARYKTLRETLTNLPQKLLRRSGGETREDFWALKDVAFDVMPGERVGIIGRNGAGKSTLLKLLSRITEPTIGKITIRGRIASLLEVGTGFHSELTGRENIYLNGAILGMQRAEIKQKFDEIVDFSGVEKFLDTPVKRYSSGMYVRLAFAVAAHLEPEILIVDEVLAVGDMEFQKKCLGKMEEVSTGEGRTVLFVSHNLDAIINLCPKSILLTHGAQIAFSDTGDIMQQYKISCSEKHKKEYDKNNYASDSYVAILSISLVDEKYTNLEYISVSSRFGIKIDYKIIKYGCLPDISIALKDDMDRVIIHDIHKTHEYDPGVYSFIVWFEKNFLNNITYDAVIGLVSLNPVVIYAQAQIGFCVEDDVLSPIRQTGYKEKVHGVVRPVLQWSKVDPSPSISCNSV